MLSAPLVLCGYDVPDKPGLIAIPHGQASTAFGGDWLLPSVLDQRLG